MLRHLNLPEVKEKVPELASVTRSKRDANLYKWEDYLEGILILERTLCQDPESLEVYQGVANIRLIK